MPRCLIIVGFPGSGKSYLGFQLCESSNFILLDDYNDPELKDLKRASELNLNVVITDPRMCIGATRIAAIKVLDKLGYEVEFIYFEPDLEACRANVLRRAKNGDTRPVNGFQQYLLNNYTIPPNSVVLEVYK